MSKVNVSRKQEVVPLDPGDVVDFMVVYPKIHILKPKFLMM